MCLTNQYLIFLVRVFIRIKGYKQSSKKSPILLKVDHFFCPSIKMQNLSQKELTYKAKNRNFNGYKIVPKDKLLGAVIIIRNNNNNNNNNNDNNNNNKIEIETVFLNQKVSLSANKK